MNDCDIKIREFKEEILKIINDQNLNKLIIDDIVDEYIFEIESESIIEILESIGNEASYKDIPKNNLSIFQSYLNDLKYSILYKSIYNLQVITNKNAIILESQSDFIPVLPSDENQKVYSGLKKTLKILPFWNNGINVDGNINETIAQFKNKVFKDMLERYINVYNKLKIGNDLSQKNKNIYSYGTLMYNNYNEVMNNVYTLIMGMLYNSNDDTSLMGKIRPEYLTDDVVLMVLNFYLLNNFDTIIDRFCGKYILINGVKGKLDLSDKKYVFSLEKMNAQIFEDKDNASKNAESNNYTYKLFEDFIYSILENDQYVLSADLNALRTTVSQLMADGISDIQLNEMTTRKSMSKNSNLTLKQKIQIILEQISTKANQLNFNIETILAICNLINSFSEELERESKMIKSLGWSQQKKWGNGYNMAASFINDLNIHNINTLQYVLNDGTVLYGDGVHSRKNVSLIKSRIINSIYRNVSSGNIFLYNSFFRYNGSNSVGLTTFMDDELINYIEKYFGINVNNYKEVFNNSKNCTILLNTISYLLNLIYNKYRFGNKNIKIEDIEKLFDEQFDENSKYFKSLWKSLTVILSSNKRNTNIKNLDLNGNLAAEFTTKTHAQEFHNLQEDFISQHELNVESGVMGSFSMDDPIDQYDEYVDKIGSGNIFIVCPNLISSKSNSRSYHGFLSVRSGIDINNEGNKKYAKNDVVSNQELNESEQIMLSIGYEFLSNIEKNKTASYQLEDTSDKVRSFTLLMQEYGTQGLTNLSFDDLKHIYKRLFITYHKKLEEDFIDVWSRIINKINSSKEIREKYGIKSKNILTSLKVKVSEKYSIEDIVKFLDQSKYAAKDIVDSAIYECWKDDKNFKIIKGLHFSNKFNKKSGVDHYMINASIIRNYILINNDKLLDDYIDKNIKEFNDVIIDFDNNLKFKNLKSNGLNALEKIIHKDVIEFIKKNKKPLKFISYKNVSSKDKKGNVTTVKEKVEYVINKNPEDGFTDNNVRDFIMNILNSFSDEESYKYLTDEYGNTFEVSVNGDIIVGKDFIKKMLFDKYYLLNRTVTEAFELIVQKDPLIHDSKANSLKSFSVEDYRNLSDLDSDISKLVEKESSDRYLMQTKRNNLLVATKIPYYPDDNGDPVPVRVPKKLRYATIESIAKEVLNYNGQSGRLVVHDGAIFTSGAYAILEGNSIIGKQTLGSRKEIGAIQEKGSVAQVKCASFEINSEAMRLGGLGSIFKKILKKMYAPCKIPLDRFGELDSDLFDHKFFKRDKYGQKIKFINVDIDYDDRIVFVFQKEDGANIEQSVFADKDGNIELNDIFTVLGEELTFDVNGIPDNSTNEFITFLLCNIYPEGKSQIIAKVLIPDTVKSAATNINPVSEWYTDGNLDGNDLMYSEADSSYFGIQSDSSHIADDDDIASPKQVINALSHNGRNVKRTKIAYDALSFLVENEINKSDIDFNDEISKKELLEDILRTLELNSSISDIKNIISDILNEYKDDGKIDIPVSDPSFFYRFATHIINKITNNSINTRFKGVGAIMNPAEDIINVFEVEKDGKTIILTKTDLLNIISQENKKAFDSGKGYIYEGFNDEIIKDFLIKLQLPDFLFKLQEFLFKIVNNVKTLELEDIVSCRVVDRVLDEDVVKQLGGVYNEFGGITVKIDHPLKLQLLDSLTRNANIEITNITNLTGRNLKPLSIKWYDENGTLHNLWTEDVVIDLINDSDNSEYKRRYRKFLRKLSEGTYIQFILSVGIDGNVYVSEIESKISGELIYKAGEQVAPKINKTKHFIGDRTMYLVINDGYLYIKERIKNNVNPNFDLIKTYKNDEYLYTINLEKLYDILFVNNSGTNELSLIEPTYDSHNKKYVFVSNIDGFICDAPSKDSKLLLDTSGNRNCYVVFIGSKSNKNNIRKSIESYDVDIFLVDEKLKKESIFYRFKNDNTIYSDLSVLNTSKDGFENDFLNNLDKMSETLAKEVYESFLASKDSISLRIPSQSFLSFMTMNTVAFTESNINDVYVNKWEQWFQGSDYDYN